MKFLPKILRIEVIEKLSFFESAILIFFSKIFLCFIRMKTTESFLGSKDGSKFWWLPWFPANSLLCVILRYIQYMWLDPLPTRLLQLWTKDIGKFLRYFDILLTLDFQICRRIFPNKRIGGNLVYVFFCISFCALKKSSVFATATPIPHIARILVPGKNSVTQKLRN